MHHAWATMRTLNFVAMKKQIQIFFLLILLVGNIKVSGQVLYTDLTPDSVSSGLPLWRTDSVLIDVNQDWLNDFVMICSTWFYFVHQNCCNCYFNRIVGLNALNKIAVDSILNSQTCSRINLDSGFCVGANYLYENVAIFSEAGPCAGWCGPPAIVPKYFPFQVSINGNISYGWFRILATYVSITLYDMAVNLTPNACITTGQTVTGISEVTNSEFKLCPNPTNGSFTIQFNKTIAIGKVQILNTIGECIYAKDFNHASQISFNLPDIPRGVYLVKIYDREIYSTMKLIVVQD